MTWHVRFATDYYCSSRQLYTVTLHLSSSRFTIHFSLLIISHFLHPFRLWPHINGR